MNDPEDDIMASTHREKDPKRPKWPHKDLITAPSRHEPTALMNRKDQTKPTKEVIQIALTIFPSPPQSISLSPSQ